MSSHHSNPSVEQHKEPGQQSLPSPSPSPSLSSPPPTLPPTAASLLQHPLQIQAKKNILHELKCPICFEILIQATATNSCGHLFCYDCIYPIYNVGGKKKKHNNRNRYNHNNSNNSGKKLPSCPTCRHEIESLTRLRMYDDLIWNMVCLNQVFFTNGNTSSDTNSNNNTNGNIHSNFSDEGRGDLETYLERSGKSIEGLNNDEKECIFGTADDNDNNGHNTTAPTSAAKKRLQRKQRRKKRKKSAPFSPTTTNNHDANGNANANGNINRLFDLTVIRQHRQQLRGQGHSGTQDDPILL